MKPSTRRRGVRINEIREAGPDDEIWQAFAVLLPVRTVGVMGDGRTCDQACSLRHTVALQEPTIAGDRRQARQAAAAFRLRLSVCWP